jgi:predicted acetyltransferase
MDLEAFKLIPALREDHPAMQNLGRFYVYDMSEFIHEPGWEMPESGLYECIDLKKYWMTENTWPFLVRYRTELAGFVIVDKKGTSDKVDFNMAQFFILRKFKGQGVGKHIAHSCFAQFQGTWEVMVIPSNTGAYRFWQKTINHYTNGNYQESRQLVAHLENSEKIVFQFNSSVHQA